jgi:uncharacterized membrane protein YgcG
MTIVMTFVFLNAFSRNFVRLNTEGSKYPFYYNKDIRIDGRLTDWPSGAFYNSSEANVIYAISNDSVRLYFCVQLADQSTQLNILHNGLVINITITGKKKKSCQIYFPYQAVESNEQIIVKGKQQPRTFTASLKMNGFNDDINGIFRHDSLPKGIETAIAYDQTGALSLEMAIPMAGFIEDLRTAKLATFGFMIDSKGKGGDPDVPNQQGGQGSGKHSGGKGGGGGSGGMGGKHGGDGGGGNGSGSAHTQNGQGHKSQNTQFKISHKFTIAPRQ